MYPLKEGYISWMPRQKLRLDMGWFDTIFGAEVADEWNNVNYSRGALYFLLQPFNHMGLRLGYAASEKIGLTFMLTNGSVTGGAPVDFDQVPAIGWQVSIQALEDLAIVVGANHAPDGTNGNKDWEHLIDVVATLNIDDFALIANTDFILTPNGGDNFAVTVGISLAALYAINEHWSAGGRVEYLGGNDNSGAPDLVTTTLTARYSPIEYLVFSLEPRIEWADPGFFPNRDGGTEDIYFGLVLGASTKIGN